MILIKGNHLNTFFIEFYATLKYLNNFLKDDININFQKYENGCEYTFNTEQLILKDRLNPIIEISKKSKIIDFSEENLKILKKYNKDNKSILVPILFDKENMIFDNQDKIYDIVFIGWMSDRRKKILESLKDLNILYVENVYDFKEKYTLILKAKILLNIHSYEESNIFEFVRCSIPIFNSMIVISENSLDNYQNCKNEINKFVLSKVIFESYNNLENKVREVLNNYNEFKYDINYEELNNINQKEILRIQKDIQNIDKEVTLLITSYNRPDLLKITLQSFIKYNTYPIKEAIIIEDSGLQGINDFVKEILTFPITLIYNEKNLGQMKSIEIAASLIKTEYTFHCEEDWEFYDYSFIEKSFEILDKDEKVLCVFLRGYEENRINSGVDIDFTDRGGYYYIQQKLFTNPNRYSGVLTFNPSLRKTIYEKACIPYEGWEEEGTLGYYFQQLGMFGAVTNNFNGYVKHIGWGRHCY